MNENSVQKGVDMFDVRIVGMLEDVAEAESTEELAVLERLVPEYPEVDIPAVRGSIEERKRTLDRIGAEVVSSEAVRMLLRELQELQSRQQPVRSMEPVRRATRKYRFIHDRLDWTDKRQVHVLMEIIKTVGKVGDVMDEADIEVAVRANAHLLETRQDPMRVFAYYKGAGGFLEHGNFEHAY